MFEMVWKWLNWFKMADGRNKGWNLYFNIPVVGKKVSVRRVANFVKNEEGERVPAKAAGNIREAFTIPFLTPGKTPSRVQKRSAMKKVNQ